MEVDPRSPDSMPVYYITLYHWIESIWNVHVCGIAYQKKGGNALFELIVFFLPLYRTDDFVKKITYTLKTKSFLSVPPPPSLWLTVQLLISVVKYGCCPGVSRIHRLESRKESIDTSDINSKCVMKEVKRGKKSCPRVKWVRLGSEILKDGHA